MTFYQDVYLLWIILITALIRTVTFKKGSSGSGNFILCADMHNLMAEPGILSCFYL